MFPENSSKRLVEDSGPFVAIETPEGSFFLSPLIEPDAARGLLEFWATGIWLENLGG